jgi:hypothetical protein
MPLDHRPHRAVEDQDAAVEERGDLGGAVGLHGRRLRCKALNSNSERRGTPA